MAISRRCFAIWMCHRPDMRCIAEAQSVLRALRAWMSTQAQLSDGSHGPMTADWTTPAYATRPHEWGTHRCPLPDPWNFPREGGRPFKEWLCPACGSFWVEAWVSETSAHLPSGPVGGGNPPWTPPPGSTPAQSLIWGFDVPSEEPPGAQISADGRLWWTGNRWRSRLLSTP